MAECVCLPSPLVRRSQKARIGFWKPEREREIKHRRRGLDLYVLCSSAYEVLCTAGMLPLMMMTTMLHGVFPQARHECNRTRRGPREDFFCRAAGGKIDCLIPPLSAV